MISVIVFGQDIGKLRSPLRNPQSTIHNRNVPREYQFPFELRHLVFFREVATRLHFRRAAESLSVAQPALSRAIAQLEAGFGVALLNRTRRRVELTPAGRILLDRVEPL